MAPLALVLSPMTNLMGPVDICDDGFHGTAYAKELVKIMQSLSHATALFYHPFD